MSNVSRTVSVFFSADDCAARGAATSSAASSTVAVPRMCETPGMLGFDRLRFARGAGGWKIPLPSEAVQPRAPTGPLPCPVGPAPVRIGRYSRLAPVEYPTDSARPRLCLQSLFCAARVTVDDAWLAVPQKGDQAVRDEDAFAADAVDVEAAVAEPGGGERCATRRLEIAQPQTQLACLFDGERPAGVGPATERVELDGCVRQQDVRAVVRGAAEQSHDD